MEKHDANFNISEKLSDVCSCPLDYLRSRPAPDVEYIDGYLNRRVQKEIEEEKDMTLGSHQSTIGKTQTWITPKWIIDKLGPFDLDPCAADPRPWDCAVENLSERGLTSPWHGRVWLNPPFHRYEVAEWTRMLARHGCGTALLHARTEAEWFEAIWQAASAILFLADRLHFHRPDGTRADANSGAPAVLVAFGKYDSVRLQFCGIPGYLVTEWKPTRAPEIANTSPADQD